MQTFFEDNNGNVWIGTNGGGVTVFEKSSQRTVNFIHSENNPNSLSHNRVWDIAQDTDNTIWIATGNGLDHISSLDEASVSRLNSNLNSDSLLYQQRIRRLLISNAGQFWIGTEEGLCVMDSLRKICDEISEFNGKNHPDIRIMSITQGDDSQLWVGTLSGLYLLNTQQRSVVPLVSTNKYPLLPHDDIRDIYYDTAGILWIASRPSGLVKVSFIGDSISGFTQFTDDQNRSQDIGRVHALLVDKQEQLWIGSTQGLLKMSSVEEGPKRYDDSLGLVDTMLEDRSENIWLGSSNGLFRKAANEPGFQNQKSKFPDKQNYYVATMFEDSNGNLWIGTTHNGLLRLNGNKITPVVFDELPQLPQSTIAAIIEDRHQFIVVAIVGFGIFRFSPDSEKFSTYRSGDMGDLHGNGVIDLLVDNTNTLWVATDNKLNQLDDIANIFHYFPQQQRSKSLAIKAMLNDTNNHIWFSSADGIYQLNTSTNSIDHYTSSNGLHGDQFVNKSGFATSKGELFFGGTSGFSRIQTADLDKKSAESKMTISRIKADDSEIMFARNRTIDTNQFTHTLKDIQFTFTDLSLLSNNTAKYRYRLIGHKSTWSTRSDQSSVSYSGLSPGSYEFQVQSVGEQSSRRSQANFRFKILPPWWQTWTAIAMYILLVGLALAAWSRWRLMSLKNKNQLLEHEIDKRSNELIQAETQLIESKKNASLTSLVVGVAHEINTPIGIAVTASSMIQHDALKLIDKFNQNKITRTEFEKALNNIIQSSGLIATNLEKSTHLIQSFKNLSTDQISQAERHINLKKYLQDVFVNLGPTIDRAGIEWSLRCDDDIELTTYPGAISQLVTQLALNAIDHAFEGIQTPKLMITAERRDDYIQLRFEDNGVGVTDELKKKIFNPFFTTRRQHGNIGLGLQIVANIVTIRLRGKINIEDNQPQGTAFVCQFLPEGKAVTTELKN